MRCPLPGVCTGGLVRLGGGLVGVVSSAAMLGMPAGAAGQLDLRFTVDGFWDAVQGALVISLVSFSATVVARPRRTA